MIRRELTKKYMPSLSLSLLRACVVRDGCVVRENCLLFHEGWINPRNRFLRALKIGRSEGGEKQNETKAKRSPQNTKENVERQVIDEEREKSKTIHADKKSTP